MCSSDLGFSEGLGFGIYGELTEAQQGALKNINDSGHRLMGLIDDILDYARSDVDPGELEIAPVEVGPLLLGCQSMMASAAEMKGMVIALDLEDESQRVLASEPHLRKLIMALLDNAVKFTPSGGSLGVRVRRAEEGTAVDIEVWDSGIGIAPEDHQRIFEPFFQLDHDKARHFEGSGLGLALGAKLAELLAGSLTVQSALGEGACFTFRCPAE